MRTGWTEEFLTISPDARGHLEAWASSRSLAHGQVRRARIVLMSAEAMSNTATAAELGLSMPAVAKWRERHWAEGAAYGSVQHGGITLSAVADITKRAPISQCRLRHRRQEFPQFPRRIERDVFQGVGIHLVSDTHSAHQLPRPGARWRRVLTTHINYMAT